MTKERKLEMITKHRKLFCFCINMVNKLRFKNKLRAKGCKLRYGVTLIKGLKIINYGKNNEIIMGDFVRINNSTIKIFGSNNKVVINQHSSFNQVELYIEDVGNQIVIGEHTHFFGKTHIAAIEGTKVLIGNNCVFSSDLHFSSGDSHSVLNLNGERINPSKDIIIEDHVWFGRGVSCLKGVRVSKDSIVAATTTLCKEYNTPNVVIAGVPGRIVKTEVNWMGDRI